MANENANVNTNEEVNVTEEVKEQATVTEAVEETPAVPTEEERQAALEEAKKKALEKQEQLKKLLVSADFKDETYADLLMQDLIILKNSAANMKTKNLEEKGKFFFEKREEFFMHLILKKVPQLENLFCVFAQATRLPFVHCDEESLNDQVWIYSNERFAQRTILKQKEQKQIDLMIVKMENSQFLQFFTSLFAMGVNELVLDKDLNSISFELTKLVKKPNYDEMPTQKRPVLNPELVLTAAYFAQGSARPQEERNVAQLKELEEEMLVNLKRGKVLVPVIFPEGETNPQLKDLKMPMLKLPNGDTIQPVCSDQAEFGRFNAKNQLRTLVVDGSKLSQVISKDAKGIMLNPVTFRMVIPKEKIS